MPHTALRLSEGPLSKIIPFFARYNPDVAAKRQSSSRSGDLLGQNGTLAQRFAREKHERQLRSCSPCRSPQTQQPPLALRRTHPRGLSEADDTVPLEDINSTGFAWDAECTPGDITTRSHAPSSPNTDGECTLWDIFTAVNICNVSIAALTAEIKGVKSEITFLQQDTQKLRERTSALEGRVSCIEDDTVPMQRDLTYNNHLLSQHTSHLEDLENRMWRNNVRAIGMPERMEGKNPVEFIEKWLITAFGKEVFSPMFSVEQAHRVTARPPQPGSPSTAGSPSTSFPIQAPQL